MDLEDPRAKPLKHLIDLLPKLMKPPTRLFLENVKNFEVSELTPGCTQSSSYEGSLLSLDRLLNRESC